MIRFSALKHLAGVVLAACVAATPMSAATFSVNWEGSNGYSLGGVFSFSDTFLGSVITEDLLDRLTFDVLLNGVSLGTADLIGPGAVENFNFDSVTGLFLTGGNSFTGNGQRWNFLGSPVGFGSGDLSQIVSVGGSGFGVTSVGNSTLVATRLPDAPAIPLPAGAVLLISGLGLAGLVGRRRRVAA